MIALPEAPHWLIAKLTEKSPGPAKSPPVGKLLPASEIKRIRSALTCIPGYDDRGRWFKVCAALKSSGAGEQVFGLGCEWSRQSDKFDLKDQRRVWDSIKVEGGIGLGTLFDLAKQNGWVDPEPAGPPAPPLSGYADDLASTQPVKVQRTREDFEQLINATKDFDVLTESLPVEIYNSGLARPTIDLLLGRIAKQARVPKSGLQEVIESKTHSHQRAGKTDSTMLALLQRYVFLKNNNRIYDTETRVEISRDGFDGAFMHLITDDKPSVVFLSDPETIKVDGLIYLPGTNANPVRRGRSVFWNLWSDPGVKLPAEAFKEDVEPWLEHLQYLYPNKTEQDHLLNWMAHVVQRPDVKINHALLVAGTSRVGKDMLMNPLRYGLGAENVCEPSAEELKESYTDYLHHSKLVIFQEIQTFDGLNLENKLKPILATPPEMLRVRLFGRGFYETPNIVQAIFMSNYKDALHISEGDGRYFAVWTDAQPLDAEYYSNLFAWLESGGNGLVARWLLDRDLSNFNPKQPAPLTQFKSSLLKSSKSPLRYQLEDMISAGDYPFNVDCVRSQDVSKVLRDKYSSKAVGSVLSEIGCIQSTCKRGHGDREKVSLYAVRDMCTWQEAPPKDWLQEYDNRYVKHDLDPDPGASHVTLF